MTLFDNLFSAMDRGSRGVRRLTVEPVLRARLASCGQGVRIGPGGSVTWRNVHVGTYSSIGPEALIWSTRAKVFIGSHVMFGPRVVIITGDHRTDLVGRYMNSVGDSEKSPNDDMDVVIEDDVWIGASAIILKGVVIGEGSVIAAGSVVARSVPPYSIAAGTPARILRSRFTPDELTEHRRIIAAATLGEDQRSRIRGRRRESHS